MASNRLGSKLLLVLQLFFSSISCTSLRTLEDRLTVTLEDGTKQGTYQFYSFSNSKVVGKNSTHDANLCLAPSWDIYTESCLKNEKAIGAEWIILNRFSQRDSNKVL